jgi:hypothetical protein
MYLILVSQMAWFMKSVFCVEVKYSVTRTTYWREVAPMPVPWFAKSDHSEPCTSAANEDAVVLLYDAVVDCKQTHNVQRRRLQQAPLESGFDGLGVACCL